MRARKTESLCLSALLLLASAGWGQTAPNTPPTDSPTLHAEARLVSVPVVVRDKKGVLVKGLAKTDFKLTVDGQQAPIRYFDQDSDLPLVLGLLVDTSMSQRAVLDDERTASTTFLQQMLTRNSSQAAVPTSAPTPTPASPEPDRAFVLQFAHQAELLQDVTDSKPKLQAALKEIDSTGDSQAAPSTQPQDNNSRGGRGGSSRGHAGTVLYDAVYLAGNEVMAKQKNRKALIILSDGDDHGSQETLAKSIESAQRADVVIYAIYFKGESPGHGGGFGGGGFPGGGRGGGGGGRGGGPPGGGGQGGGYPGGGGGRENEIDGKKVLQRMCDETGGRLFEVKGKQTVAAIYNQIGDELRSQYRLGYSPTAADAAEGYHKVEVTVPAQPKDFVQARDGYYGK